MDLDIVIATLREVRGHTVPEIVADLPDLPDPPDLTAEDIAASLRFAADLAQERHIPVTPAA